MLESRELLWFLAGLLFIVSEFVVPGFVIAFFGVGAWVTAACMALGIVDSFNAELMIFLAASGLSLALFREKGRKYFEGKVTGAAAGGDLESVKGGRGVVIDDILPHGRGGKVEFHGTLWSAEAEVPIPKGTVVEVLERINLTLKVKPIA